MCGKLTAQLSWADALDLPDGAQAGGESRTYRVMDDVPLVVWNGGERQILVARWGFPDPKDWRRPRPIHARGETIDETSAFARAFRDGQRGILITETFNEAPENGAQHTVTPAGPVGIAMLWRRFDAGDISLLACVMVTVAANTLLRGLPTDRMPAILAPEDWATWLGEDDSDPASAKACLKTVEDARWRMSREERARTARRARPTVSDPGGLF